MNILVCGGAGFIGSHVAAALAEAGHQPVVFDNLSAGHRWAVQWGPLVEGDLLDQALVESTLRTHRIDAVVQLAGSINVGESMQNPGKYFRNNFAISLSLLQAMDAAEVRRIVFSSTAAVYGIPATSPIPEDAPKAPINPYGEAKYFVERLLHWYTQVRGFQCLALRYFNAAGADPEARIGEMHSPETHLIPLVIYAAMGQRPPVKIFGADYPTHDGTAVRDYIHVADLARAHVSGLEYLAAGGASNAVNLGAGQGASVLEVLAAVAEVSGQPVPHEFHGRRAGDPPHLVAQAGQAASLLNWQPLRSQLHAIVEDAWRWSRKAIDAGLYCE
jgi:UDP-glucose-4-epimerase GalE